VVGKDFRKLVEPEEGEGGQQRTLVRDTLREDERISVSALRLVESVRLSLRCP